MTVSSTAAASGPFTGNGSTTAFPFTFKAMTTGEVGVLVDSVEVATGFTVTLNSGGNGGTVTFGTAPASGAEIVPFSKPDFTQDIAFQNNGPFLAETHEEALDRAAVRDLRLKADIVELADDLDDAVEALEDQIDSLESSVSTVATDTAAALAAIAAAGIVPGTAVSVASRGLLAALDTANGAATLTEAGREGLFVWSDSDLSAEVARDTRQAVYVAPASDPNGSSGAWVRKFDGPFNITWFMETGDDDDLAPAVEAAAAFGATYFPIRCVIPDGHYRWESPVRLTTSLFLEGSGSAIIGWAWGGVQIVVPAGVTPLLPYGDAVSSPQAGGIRGLNFRAEAKLATTGSGTISLDDNELTLSAAGDFEDWQVIAVRGAGPEGLLKGGNARGATTSGSPIINLSGLIYATSGVYPDMVLSTSGVGAAFPAGSYVVSSTDTSITMSANATATLSDQEIYYRDDLHALIIAGGGTTTLTLSALAHVAVTNAKVIHFDCALLTHSYFKVDNCNAAYFQGAGFAALAGGRHTVVTGIPTNANAMRWSDVTTYSCRTGIIWGETDCNAGQIDNAYSVQDTEYSFIDKSLGSTWNVTHVDGGLGFKHVLDVSQSHFQAAYHEQGTTSTFGRSATGDGWQAADEDGGARLIPNGGGGLAVPSLQVYPNGNPTRQAYIGQRTATAGLVQLVIPSGSSSLHLFDTHKTGVVSVTDQAAGCTLLSFTMANHSTGAGNVLLDNGVYLGNGTDTTGAPTMSNFRHHMTGSAAPVSGTWVQGDIVWNNAPAAGGTLGWVCTAGGTPGTWKAISGIAA